MLPLILALLAAGAAQPNTVAGVEVTAQPKKPPPADLKLQMQGDTDDISQLVATWPSGAYQSRANGKVTLRCEIDIHGLAERCAVIYESPAGKGFGRAALVMRPTFLFPPTLSPDGPVAATKTIQITFKAPDTTGSGNAVDDAVNHPDRPGTLFAMQSALDLRKVTVLETPIWAAAATFEDLDSAYPAKGGGLGGYAVAHCQMMRTGALKNCVTTKEEPQGHGFGKAALSLAAKFTVAHDLAAAHYTTFQVWTDIPVRFSPPTGGRDRTVMAPVWLTAVDPAASLKLFPPEAVAKGLSSGRGVVRCTVGADGGLTACVPEPGEPPCLGFSEAVAKLAPGLKMNLWSADGAPVQGGVIRIPVQLKLKGG